MGAAKKIESDRLLLRPEEAPILVERYSMSISAEIVLGEPKAFRVRDWTSRTFEPHRIVANAPCEGFVMIDDASVDNIDVLLDDNGMERFESHDAHHFSGEGKKIKPYLCEHGLGMYIKYTGLVPERFEKGQTFLFCLSFRGPCGGSLKRETAKVLAP